MNGIKSYKSESRHELSVIKTLYGQVAFSVELINDPLGEDYSVCFLNKEQVKILIKDLKLMLKE